MPGPGSGWARDMVEPTDVSNGGNSPPDSSTASRLRAACKRGLRLFGAFFAVAVGFYVFTFMWFRGLDDHVRGRTFSSTMIRRPRDALLIHLGMSGQVLITSPDKAVAKQERARFTFTDGGSDLRFDDQRTVGHLMHDEGGAVLPSPIAHIGRDPFDPQFDQAATAARIKTRRTGIKRALLDQTLVSGIGNIYAEEALWAPRYTARRRPPR